MWAGYARTYGKRGRIGGGCRKSVFDFINKEENG